MRGRWNSFTWRLFALSINAAKLVDRLEIGCVDDANGCRNQQRSWSLCGLLQIMWVYYTQIRLKRLQRDSSEPASLMGQCKWLCWLIFPQWSQRLLFLISPSQNLSCYMSLARCGHCLGQTSAYICTAVVLFSLAFTFIHNEAVVLFVSIW